MLKSAKKIHIILIIIGTIFISLSLFHTNLWFDETFSVSIASHSFSEIWSITAGDVHPPLYYWMLRVLYLIFGKNILVYRMFSMLGITLFASLGYTHIRKDLGEKAGITFSFFAFFLPIMCIYANQIRMYSWTMIFVTLAFIYAYRILKKSTKINWCLFGLFSLASAYTHYYGLLAVGIINVVLFVYLCKEKQINNIKLFLIAASIQILLYVPWLISFIKQLVSVSEGFWIELIFPKTYIQIVSFQFGGDINTTGDIHTYIASAIAVILYIYIGYSICKMKKSDEKKWTVWAFGLYLLVISFAFIISLVTPILYARYLFTINGLFIFGLSYLISKEEKKYIAIIICAVMIALSVFNNITLIKSNYDESNMKQIEYLQENIRPDDIIIYSNIGIGSVIATYFVDSDQYYYSTENWDATEAFKAYAPQMTTITDLSYLDEYKGRIWLIDSEDLGLYNNVFKNDGYLLKSTETFVTAYQNYIYNIVLIEK